MQITDEFLDNLPDARKPDITFYTKAKGGRRGVWVEAWVNFADGGEPIIHYKLYACKRRKISEPWKKKVTWTLPELETLFHILRMDAIPWGFRVLQGQEQIDGPS